MKIKERAEYLVKPDPLTCKPGTGVREAVKEMAARDYGAIVVTDETDKVLGLMTERDVMKRIVAGGLDPDNTKVEDVMTRNVRVARADDDLYNWLRIMSNERFRRLPIVDETGKLISIMTQGDFVSYTWPELLQQGRTLAKSLVSSNYQVFLILAGVLAYTLLVLVVGNL